MLRTARILTALALVVLAPLEAMARWTELRSENFLFIGDAPERTIRTVAQKLEQFRDVMVRVLPDATMASPVPTVVVVFGGPRSFAPYRPEFRGRPVELAGYFIGSDDINYIAIDAESSDLAFKVIFHEDSHFLLQTWMGRAPVWVSEGLAEVYATFQTRDGGNSAVLGAPDGAHLQLLQSTTLIPLRELLTIDQSSPTYNEGLRRGVLYAQEVRSFHFQYQLASARASMPLPSVKLEPTAPTTAVRRVRPSRLRRRYTASIPVQCAPSRCWSPNSRSLPAVHSRFASVAANR